MDATGPFDSNSHETAQDLSNKSHSYQPPGIQPPLSQEAHNNGHSSSQHNHRITSNVDNISRDAVNLIQQPMTSGVASSASWHNPRFSSNPPSSRIWNPIDTPITNPNVYNYHEPNVMYAPTVPIDHFEPKNVQPQYVHQSQPHEEPTGDILDLDSKQIVHPPVSVNRDRLPPINSIRSHHTSLMSNSRSEMFANYTTYKHAPPRILYYSPQAHHSVEQQHPVVVNTRYSPPAAGLTPEAASLLEAANRNPMIINSQYNALPSIRTPAAVLPTDAAKPNPAAAIDSQNNLTAATSSAPLKPVQTAKPHPSVVENVSSIPAVPSTGSSSNPELPSTPKSPEKSFKRKSSVLLQTPKTKQGKRVSRRSNEKKLKTYNCSNCDKWFTTTGHLRRHFKTALHKKVVDDTGQIDAATFPSRQHHFPERIQKLTDHQSDDSQSQPQLSSLDRESDCLDDDSEPPESDDELDASQSSQSPNDHPNEQAGPLICASLESRDLLKTLCSLEEAQPDQKNEDDQRQNQVNQDQLKRPESVTPPLDMLNSEGDIHAISTNEYRPVEKVDYPEQWLKTDMGQISPIFGDVKSEPIDCSVLPSSQHPGQALLPELVIDTADLEYEPPVACKRMTAAKQLATLFGYGFGRKEYSSDSDEKSTSWLNSPEFLESASYSFPECQPEPKWNEVALDFSVNSPVFSESATPMEGLVEWEKDSSLSSPPPKRRKTEGPDKTRLTPKSLELDRNLKYYTNDDESPTSVSSLDTPIFEYSRGNSLNMYTNDPQKLRCDECNKEFTRRCYLTQHKNAAHRGDMLFRCQVCGKRYSDKSTYQKHLTRHGVTTKKFKCPFCPRQYFYQSDLKRHLYSHTDWKRYTCELCDKGFSRQDHLRSHYEMHQRKKMNA